MQNVSSTSHALSIADGILVIEIAMGAALIAGGVLARRRRFRAHAWCQSTVVLLNLPLIALFMARPYWQAVAPGLMTHLGRPYYWVSTLHGVLGIGAELLGLYLILAAGTQLLPQRLRLTRYKFWMRTAVALWWLVLLLGVFIHLRW